SVVPDAPLPTDPRVLAGFAATNAADAPGLRHPQWLLDACAASPAQGPRTALRRNGGTDVRARATNAMRYRAGLLGPAELVATLPARELAEPSPGSLPSTAGRPVARAVKALLTLRLGADPKRWLTAMAAMDTADSALPLAEFLDRAGAQVPPVGDHLPLSKAGASLLAHADVDVLRTVLPLLEANAPLTLVRHAVDSRHATDALIEYVLGCADPTAAIDLAHRSIGPARRAYLRTRLLALRDPDVDDRLYGDVTRVGDVAERRRILSGAEDLPIGAGPGAPTPLSPALRARLLAPGVFSKYRAGALLVTVEAADADVVETALRTLRGKLTLLDHLTAARNALRYGGVDRLRALIDDGLLGRGAAKVAVKALEAGGVEAGARLLTDRLDRERTTARLVAKLRGCDGSFAAERVLVLPYPRDWPTLIEEHAREPFRPDVWQAVAFQPDAPDAATLAVPPSPHSTKAAEAALRSPALARSILAWATPVGGSGGWTALMDRAIEDGLITGHDLVHEIGTPDRALRYVAEGLVRVDLPVPVRTAVRDAFAEITRLTVDALGTGDRAWQRLFGALTGHDDQWAPDNGPDASVAVLIGYAGRELRVEEG
ncbi:hypothetical protein, partial [Streptomyces sp. SID3343]|uniref:hypothetical protein n=1 Tax=Streptomyces sp. SID3343 TaxID=2690260 RepID=UPI0013706879